MGGSSVEVADAPPRPAPKRKPRPDQGSPLGLDQVSSPRRPPAPRKRVSSTKPVATIAQSTAEAVIATDATEAPASTSIERDFFDDLDFQKQVVAETDAVVGKTDAEEWVEQQVEARQPYVLPKIIPAEPDLIPDEELTELPDELVAAEPALEPALREAQVVPENALKPKVVRLTKKLARSLQPVIVPRQRPRVRRVTRVVRHIDTWSVFKIAVLFNIFLYAVCLIAGVMLWRVALNTGTIENIERFFESFGWRTFELKGGEIYHNAWIAGLFAMVGFTGLAVLAATMFNLITDLVGGVRLTVLEEEVTAREQRVTTWPRLLRPSPPPHREPPLD